MISFACFIFLFLVRLIFSACPIISKPFLSKLIILSTNGFFKVVNSSFFYFYCLFFWKLCSHFSVFVQKKKTVPAKLLNKRNNKTTILFQLSHSNYLTNVFFFQFLKTNFVGFIFCVCCWWKISTGFPRWLSYLHTSYMYPCPSRFINWMVSFLLN